MRKHFNLATVLIWVLSLVSCSRISAPEGFKRDVNWEMTRSEHFIFYYRAGSFAERNMDSIIDIEEYAYEHILNSLQLQYNGIISIYIYDSPEDAGWDRVKAIAYPRVETVEAIYSPVGKSIGIEGAACHEITHVITWNTLGEPGTQFLSEGVAVAMDGEWHSQLDTITDLHLWVKKFIEEGTLPELDDLIESWGSVPGSISYPASGSFVLYLLDMYGAERFKQLFYRATSANFHDEFQKIYNISLPVAEQMWKDYCKR